MNNIYSWGLVICCSISSSFYAAEERKRPLSPLENSFAGAAAGVVDVVTTLPLNYFKNQLQQGLAISSNPRVWWRGVWVSAGSMAPVTATQLAVKAALMSGSCDSGPSAECASAVVAGGVSGLISGPSESAILYAQQRGTGPIESLRRAPLATGLGATMLREAGFAGGSLWARPLAKRFIATHTDNPVLVEAGAGVIAGIATAVLTQPFDVVATDQRRQAMNTCCAAPDSAIKTARRLYRTGGLASLYRGLMPRTINVGGGIVIIGVTQDKITEYMRRYV